MFKKKQILLPVLLSALLLLASCKGNEEKLPLSSEDNSSVLQSDTSTIEQEEEKQPVYTEKISISNDFPELEIKLFADQDDMGIYHAQSLEIYHASISTLPMQIIELDDCESDTADFALTVEDMNFDGVKDLRLVSSKGVQNTYYHCYVWDINSASFVLDEVLSSLASPKVVEDERAVTFLEYLSTTDSREGTMKYLDGNWTLTMEKTQQFDEQTNLFTVTTKELKDGTLQVTDEKTMTQEELENQTSSQEEEE